MDGYIVAIDQGTTSSRAVLFDKYARVCGIAQQETTQIYPESGWVEQSPEEIWESQYRMITGLLEQSNIEASAINAIGITNQRETTILWDKFSGKPVYNAVVWQDNRTAPLCNQLKADGLSEMIHKKTGLVIDSYFSATKIAWILDNVEGVRYRAEKGEILFGTVDSYLAWKLSGGELHITDVSNASRTMLYNISECTWDKDLLRLFNIPECILPTVVESAKIYGKTSSALFDGTQIPIASIIGDQQSALFGHGAFTAGQAKNTYGTGCFLLMNTGNQLIYSDKGLLTTIAWKINDEVFYALEGSVFIAGALIKWIRDNLNLISSAEETEKMAEEVNHNNGVYIVPAFSGLGAPYWNMNVKGLITGLTLSTNKKHIVRAAIESMAYQTKQLTDIMQEDSGIILNALHVDGGAAANKFLLRFQAELLNTSVFKPDNLEITALGTALLAGMACGLWNQENMTRTLTPGEIFSPGPDHDKRLSDYEGWKKAVRQTLS